MGYGLDQETVRNIIAAIIAIIVYWIKISLDNHANKIETTLTNINNNIHNTQIVNVYSDRVRTSGVPRVTAVDDTDDTEPQQGAD
ncbi:MAG: hypothetical protein BA864_06960 [Desulfuromonadales bacterium C00003093]|nr:MAG: hypothetical protein BA864_06960 [Desulfuromonadales bacterium C00003093]